ncbi:MAG: RES family NAD+ phosphorylase [Rhodanobacter sp.]
MGNARKQGPPRTRSLASIEQSRPGLLELDRFSETHLAHWKRLSGDLDELNGLLYYGVEPQRQRHHTGMIEALQSVEPATFSFSRSVRLVTWRYTNDPLCAAGSLTSIGGRFNIGVDVDGSMHAPWPALYIGEDFETGYREKFQLERGAQVDGLSPTDLALDPGSSFSVVCLDGHLERVFDIDQPGALDALCAVLRKMHLPADVRGVQRRLQIPDRTVFMINTVSRLRAEALDRNWRVLPAQFGLPSPSQILAGLVLDAGFEAIRYPSTKGGGHCLAVFPHKLTSDESYVSLSDQPPTEIKHTRLDMTTADGLCGWEMLRPSQRPGREG